MEPATISVLGTLGGAILGGVISYHAATRVIKRQEFNKAAASFRLAFLDLLLFLKEKIEPEGFTDFVSYLHRLYPQHAAAIIEFTPSLDSVGVESINKAWFNYKFPNGIPNGDELTEAFPLDDYARISEPQRITLEKIENLLSIH